MGITKFAVPGNFIIFQTCWFACVMGAAKNLGWLGPLLVLITVPLQINLLTENHRAEFIFVVICGFSGFILETLMILGSVYAPVSQEWGFICPPWMAALWFNFALLVSISLAWLKGKYAAAALLGGLAGPVAYWGGDKLGALRVAATFSTGYLILAVMWALALPLLVYLHDSLTRARHVGK
ncbi:MAG: hypothetical protein AMK70_01550 [Nitrospira bacterium SG8_35_1]|nr:MAG: hypothetical protein AMK70_01550 [Nitrospira bacterium SG8_35_1]